MKTEWKNVSFNSLPIGLPENCMMIVFSPTAHFPILFQNQYLYAGGKGYTHWLCGQLLKLLIVLTVTH